MNQLLGHSITFRIVVGPQAERKVFSFQTLQACESDDYADTANNASDFSLHAGVAARSDECEKLEHLSEDGPDDTSAVLRFRESGFHLRHAATSVISRIISIMALCPLGIDNICKTEARAPSARKRRCAISFGTAYREELRSGPEKLNSVLMDYQS